MKWLRLYHSVLNDPKIQSLDPADFKLWINLLIIASENEPRGVLPPLSELSFLLRVRSDRLQPRLNSLLTQRCLDHNETLSSGSDVWSLHDWEQWQYDSDDINKRVNQHRTKKRNVACNVSGNDPVTPSDNRVQIQSTDTEKRVAVSVTEPSTVREVPQVAAATQAHTNGKNGKALQPTLSEDAVLFRTTCEEYGMHCGEEEWINFFTWHWDKGSLEKKLAAIDGLRQRIAAGDKSLIDTVPRNYFNLAMWGRNIRAPAASERRRPLRDPLKELENL